MTHKTEESYLLVFSNLKIISEALKFPLNPTVVMCDFLNALRNAIKKFFHKFTCQGAIFNIQNAYLIR